MTVHRRERIEPQAPAALLDRRDANGSIHAGVDTRKRRRYAEGPHPLEILALVNQKGGVGKTVTAINLGTVLALAGKRVLLIDLDPQAHMSVLLGIPPNKVPNVFETDTPEPQSTPIEGMECIPGNTKLIAYGHRLHAEAQHFALWERFNGKNGRIRELKYDVVILDCPPHIDGTTENAIVAAHTILIPVEMKRTNLAMCSETYRKIRELQERYPRGHRYQVTDHLLGIATRYTGKVRQQAVYEKAGERLPFFQEAPIIRVSSIYEAAEDEGVPAAALGARTSYPVVDHQALAARLGLLAPAGAPVGEVTA